MGSGKSTWAINYINKNTDKKFLCIVPLLDECKRYKENTDIDIIDPESWGSKWKHFRWLVENEKKYCYDTRFDTKNGFRYVGITKK